MSLLVSLRVVFGLTCCTHCCFIISTHPFVQMYREDRFALLERQTDFERSLIKRAEGSASASKYMEMASKQLIDQV
jgi:hypothetical protein